LHADHDAALRLVVQAPLFMNASIYGCLYLWADHDAALRLVV